MTKSEFKKIMEEGFKIETSGNENGLRCFECGEVTEIEFSKIKCNNKHSYNFITFMILHIEMRNEITEKTLNAQICETIIQEQYEDFNNEESFF